jgi:hypothetical protein
MATSWRDVMTLTPEMQKLREAINREKVYIDCLQEVANDDVTELRRKDAEYGGSWKKRGGVGAYMMACRKMDRLEEQLKKVSYDIFAAIEGDTRAEGVLDDVRDLRRYLMLIEAEMIARGVVK